MTDPMLVPSHRNVSKSYCAAQVALPLLSVVVPVYGSPESLAPLAQRVKEVCAKMSMTYELILVDDRCPKGSWFHIDRLKSGDHAIVGVRLSRNFGQHAAIQAGLACVRGQWVVVMDCDLQDRPEEIPRLWAKAQEGFEIVRAQRLNRNDPLHRRFTSSLFYAILSYLTETHQDAGFANFGIYSRKVIDIVTQWHEESKYFPAILSWIGFAQAVVAVEQDPRYGGNSSYTITKLIKLATNVIVGFSDKPLKLVMTAGSLIAFLAFSVSLFILIAHLMGYLTVEGWASITLSLWFLSGCLLFALGLTGLYVGRILVEVKGRPCFIIDQILMHTAEETVVDNHSSGSVTGHTR